MDRLINMILRQITRRLVNKGINAGFRKAGSVKQPGSGGPEHAPNRQKQIRKAAKMLRHTTRF